MPGRRGYLVLPRPHRPRPGLPGRSRTGRRGARWTGPEAAAIFKPGHVLSPLCRTLDQHLRGHPCAGSGQASRPPAAASISSFRRSARGGTISPRGPAAPQAAPGPAPARLTSVAGPGPGPQAGSADVPAYARRWHGRIGARSRWPLTVPREEANKQTAMFHADLHIHSKFSRACSRDCDIPHIAAGALRKGISVVGTGDFTHPAWADELKNSLVPAEAGLLRLRPDLERDLRRHAPAACEQPVRFMLSVEISTIYRHGERTRKVHHLIYAPAFEGPTASLVRWRRSGTWRLMDGPSSALTHATCSRSRFKGGPAATWFRHISGHHGSLFLVHGPVSTRSPTATAILLPKYLP